MKLVFEHNDTKLTLFHNVLEKMERDKLRNLSQLHYQIHLIRKHLLPIAALQTY